MVDTGLIKHNVWHHLYVYVQYTLHWSTSGLHISVHAHVLSCDQDNTLRPPEIHAVLDSCKRMHETNIKAIV